MAKRFDNISKNNKNINALSDFFSSDDRVEETPSVQQAPLPKANADFVRQTLIMSSDDLDLLRNMVYTRRSEGKVTYTQKEALQEIIAYFRTQNTHIQERPDEVRVDEQKRSERIIKGKK